MHPSAGVGPITYVVQTAAGVVVYGASADATGTVQPLSTAAGAVVAGGVFITATDANKVAAPTFPCPGTATGARAARCRAAARHTHRPRG